jgi:hypothetical protein
MATLVRYARVAAWFLLNSVLAILGTVVLASPFEHAMTLIPQPQLIMREEILNGVTSFGLGYFAYRTWKSASSKWIWVAGLCWFAQRAFRFWLEQRSSASVLYQGHTVYWQMSGAGCGFDATSCRDWADYTLQFLRTAFYSAGALCCPRLGGSVLVRQARASAQKTDRPKR